MNAEFQRIARRGKKTFFHDQCKEIEGKKIEWERLETSSRKLEKPREHFIYSFYDKSIVYMYHVVFIHLSVDGHLGCFHVLAVVNNAAMNFGCRAHFKVCFPSLVWCTYMLINLSCYIKSSGWINFNNLCKISIRRYIYFKWFLHDTQFGLSVQVHLSLVLFCF